MTVKTKSKILMRLEFLNKTQSWLARETNESTLQIWRYCHNKGGKPRVETAIKIAKALEDSVENLFG